MIKIGTSVSTQWARKKDRYGNPVKTEAIGEGLPKELLLHKDKHGHYQPASGQRGNHKKTPHLSFLSPPFFVGLSH